MASSLRQECAHCIDLETAPLVGHIYAKAQAHRLANEYAEDKTKNLMGILYIGEYTRIYSERFEELYMTFRSTHLVVFIDKLYEIHKDTPNLCSHHGLLVPDASLNST